MLCFSRFELYSRWVPLKEFWEAATYPSPPQHFPMDDRFFPGSYKSFKKKLTLFI